MSKIHLLSNAHLDPVWLWRWKEGAAEAVSTFRVAADFCERYDAYVFNHNEALLYEWVEEYEPELFERIKRLVKKGNWKIMGGWYLQPDCLMPSGESFLSQISLGNDYFMEKFGVKPTTTINFDPFGHTRGLVQILSKTGYDSYLYMRPYGPERTFRWKGFDGSEIIGHHFYGGYNTLKGEAVKRIEDYMRSDYNGKLGICLWGVGNHGGGPSEIDVNEINEFIKEHPELEIIHSDAESFFREVEKENLPIEENSLGPCMVGCYTTMVRVKKAHRHLENQIAVAEKMMTAAHLEGKMEYEDETLTEAKKALAFCEFHDILPGTSIPGGEEDALRTMGHGDELCDRLIAKAFFALSSGQKKAKEKEIPILIYNPHPYEIEGEFEVEFMLENQNWNEGEQTIARVYDKDGNFLPTQNEKPDCTFSLDWIEKVSFRGTLAPFSVNRFDCVLEVVKDYKIAPYEETEDEILVKTPRLEVAISKKTGHIERYLVGGVPKVQRSGVLEVYKDNEDPWGMLVDDFKEKIGEFTLLSDAEANHFVGYDDETLPNVRVVENGDIRMKVQAFFGWGKSVAVVEYTIPKQDTYIDVDVSLFMLDANKMVKYRLDTALLGEFYGQTAFGTEKMRTEGREAVFQKWCGIVGEKGRISVINDGIHGGSFDESTIWLSLLRTPVYSAHPINDRPIAPHNRYLKHIDMGERNFRFRITPTPYPDREALLYNEAPIIMSFFPSGEGEKKESGISMTGNDILLTALKKVKGKTVLHFYNSSPERRESEVTFMGKKTKISLSPFELKFFRGDENGLKETEFIG